MSQNKMLIDASHEEETRVVVLKQGRVQEFDFEAAARKLLKGSIYLAKVTRVEPSLQAAFVDFGGNRHGFLAFNEVHPDYYQIPVADREALLAEQAEERARLDADEDDEDELEAVASSTDDEDDDTDGEVIEIDDPDIDDEADDEAADNATGADITDVVASSTVAEPDEDDQPTIDQSVLPSESDDDHLPLPELSDEVIDAAEASAIDVTDILPGDETTAEPATDDDTDSTTADSMPLKTVGDDVQKSAPVLEDRAPAEVDADDGTDADAVGDQDVSADSDATDDVTSDGDDITDDEDSDAEQPELRAKRPQRNGRGRNGSNGARAPRRRARQYKIQEVIKRRQIVLVQVVKEERGNKGAALTTYLSLAGRYTVLMPNTARGGGISRKITNAQDRKRLKSVVQDLDVPEGMGLIVRTAGAARTKQEIKRDFDYLLRLWETVRDLTLRSKAPALVYEEGNLIKRAIRDLYSKEIDEVVVSGDDAHRSAKDFMKMLMPSHAKNVVKHEEPISLFKRYGIEPQLNALFSPIVTLPSGGYLVINQTEALVAIDINSGRSTREFSIEETAYKTNLEAADEIARQLKLRDLAGLVVIDFIDMDEKRNNRGVERRLKEALKSDRARIQVGRISHFGLLEMSRQRLRTGMLEGSTTQCEHCQGTGIVRSVESIALSVLRGIEDAVEPNGPDLTVKTAPQVAFYLLNQKRQFLSDLEERCDVSVNIMGSPDEQGANFKIETSTGEQAPRPSARRARPPAISVDHGFADADEDDPVAVVETDAADDEDSETSRGGRRRRRRRGGRREDRDTRDMEASVDDEATTGDDEDAGSDESRGRKRGRRGGQRNRGRGRNGSAAFEAPAEYDVDPSEFEELLGVSADIYVAQAKTVASAAAAARRRMVSTRRRRDDFDGDETSERETRGRRRGGERGRNDRAAQARTIAAAAADLQTGDQSEPPAHDDQPIQPQSDRPKRSRRRRGKQSETPRSDDAVIQTVEIDDAAADLSVDPKQEQPAATLDQDTNGAVSQNGEIDGTPTETAASDTPAVGDDVPMAKAEVDAIDVEPTEQPRTHWGEQAASTPVVQRVIVSSPGDATEAAEDEPTKPAPEKPQRKGWWQRNFG